MKHFRNCLLLAALLGLALNGSAQKGPAQKALIKRTYYDYQNRQLREEYQYARTANKLEVKNGYYKEYDENGVIMEKSFYANDALSGISTEYADYGNGPEPATIDTYKAGKRNGYSAIWQYVNERRFKTFEGNYVNDRQEGRQVDYDGNGSHKVSHYHAGVLNGEYTEYDATGRPTLEGYLNEGEKFSGTLDETFDNGKPSKSVTYNDGRREGPTQTWYPNGKLRTLTQYRKGQQNGPTLRYLETGEPETASKIALAQFEAANATDLADSIRQERTAAIAIEHEAERKAVERHQHDSLQLMVRNQEKMVQANIKASEQAYSLASNAITRQMFMCNEAAAGQRTRLPRQLYVELYNKLLADYKGTPDGLAKLAKAQRIVKLLDLAVTVESGHQTALEKAIRKGTDLDKILALSGL